MNNYEWCINVFTSLFYLPCLDSCCILGSGKSAVADVYFFYCVICSIFSKASNATYNDIQRGWIFFWILMRLKSIWSKVSKFQRNTIGFWWGWIFFWLIDFSLFFISIKERTMICKIRPYTSFKTIYIYIYIYKR